MEDKVLCTIKILDNKPGSVVLEIGQVCDKEPEHFRIPAGPLPSILKAAAEGAYTLRADQDVDISEGALTFLELLCTLNPEEQVAKWAVSELIGVRNK